RVAVPEAGEHRRPRPHLGNHRVDAEAGEGERPLWRGAGGPEPRDAARPAACTETGAGDETAHAVRHHVELGGAGFASDAIELRREARRAPLDVAADRRVPHAVEMEPAVGAQAADQPDEVRAVLR